MVEEWVKAYELEHGKRPSEAAIRMARYIDKHSGVFCKQGQRDAADGRSPESVEKFVQRARYAFHNNIDEEAAQIFGTLWFEDYMDGYQQKGGAVWTRYLA